MNKLKTFCSECYKIVLLTEEGYCTECGRHYDNISRGNIQMNKDFLRYIGQIKEKQDEEYDDPTIFDDDTDR